MNIDDKINKLNQEEIEIFLERREQLLYSRDFFRFNNMNYSNPDMKKVNEIVYKMLFELR